ncbi:Sperm-associated antigen 1 [Labeo rohita]|uniref:Sperm-associated antigen 1 n=1 Tax=Labeo rohita TaxID=84645 RepID=A0ABQ8LW04_LABRO|nr:Sperm-associated antigen 1 [Labeo rohita]
MSAAEAASALVAPGSSCGSFCEKHIEKLDPKSRVLRKENRPATAASFSSEEWRNISEDLQMWESSMRLNEAQLKRRLMFSDGENVPPVRSSHGPIQRSVSTAVKTGKTSCVPRSYRDWDRFDVEAECANTDESDRNSHHASIRPSVPEITPTINSTALTAQEKDALARREKDKGNEAFRSGDYEEAVVYYSRSLSLASSAAALNNRAQAHIRLQRWSAALNDSDAKLLTDETESDRCEETRSTGRKILIQEVDDDEEEDEGEDECLWSERETSAAVLCSDAQDEKRDASGTESGIMGNTQMMLSCTNVQTDEPTNDNSSSRRGGSAAEQTPVDAHTEAPPTEHAHLNNEGNRSAGETQTEKHTHDNTEHTTAEFALLKDDGNALVRSGCYQEAVDRYTECLQLKPHECAVYTNRALCYIKLQRFTEARQDCDSALQLQPTNKKAFYRRALANKGLKAEQLLMEVTRLMTDSRCSSGARRSVTITEVEDDDDDEDEGSSAVGPQRCSADVSSVSLWSSSVFEFGQALNGALSHGDLLTCAELLRSVSSERLPRLIGTQLDGRALGFIIRALNTHLLHTRPETMVLMLLDGEDRSQLSQIFQKLRAVQTEAFSQSDVTNLANKYM